LRKVRGKGIGINQSFLRGKVTRKRWGRLGRRTKGGQNSVQHTEDICWVEKENDSEEDKWTKVDLSAGVSKKLPSEVGKRVVERGSWCQKGKW